MPNVNEIIARLQAEGLLHKDAVDAEVRDVLANLTDAELDQVIALAKRFYPGDPSMVELADLRSGKMRIFIPL
jgi:hypothetical protein